MEEGQIIKEGGFFKLKAGKKYYKLDWFPKIKDKDVGEFVDFELTQNNIHVHSITFSDNRTMTKQNPNPPNWQGNNNQNRNEHQGGGGNPQDNNLATAPYNFISLNKTVVPSEFEKIENIPSFDKWHTKLAEKEIFNGYIDYNITNLTDMFIGNETNANDENCKNIFSLDAKGEQPMVSGSSFRGLIKNIMTICSYSKLSQLVGSKNLFYRNLKNLENFLERSNTNVINDTRLLNKILTNKDNRTNGLNQEKLNRINNEMNRAINSPSIIDFSKIFAGFLTKSEDGYKIKPCLEINNTQYFRVNSRPDYDEVNNKIRFFPFTDGIGNLEEFSLTVNIYFTPVNVENHLHFSFSRESKKKVIPYFLRYGLVSNYNSNDFTNAVKGTLLITGGLQKNKHLHWILNEPVTNKVDFLPVSKNIIDVLNQDETINIPEKYRIQERIKLGDVPIFYILEPDGKVKMIGHTAIFRQQYAKSIQDHLTETHKKYATLDITEALFGMSGENGKKIFASRLNFMDAKRIVDNGQLDYIEPKLLSSPKPTAYSMYLVQQQNSKNDWNSEAGIRGFKLYHHSKLNIIEEKGKWKEKSHPKKIKPLKQGNQFQGRIYFENLTKVELGALLLALQLEDNMHHQMGMGKPYGMGTIKVDNIKLTTIDRKVRYSKLFSTNKKTESAFNLGEKEDVKTEEFIKEFKNYILNNLTNSEDIKDKNGNTVTKEFWQLKRMQELAAMMNPKTEWQFNDIKITNEYMSDVRDQRWRDKKPLPKIEHITKL